MSTDPQRRTTLGPYRVVDFLGAGGMGEVYRGVHLTTGRVAALKRLTASARTPAMVERFRNEARIQATLSHPHIATLYDAFEDDGVPCIAMEYIAGESLDQVIARGPLAADTALAWFAQVVDAVAYIHGRGIVHRDLKSNNVRLDEQGHAHLLDFGIARSGDSPRLTTDGSVIGTLHYLSPEQVAGAPATAASDTWALGVLLYEMVTARVPFASESLTGVMARILKGAYDPPVVHGTAVPGPVSRIIARCLTPEPAQRYPSADALLADVRRIATPAPRARGHTAPLPRRWPLAASGTAAGLALAFLLWSVTDRPAPVPPGVDADTARGPAPVTDTTRPDRDLAAPATNGGEHRTVTIKVFGDTPAEVWREGVRVGLTPASFDAPVGAWIRLTLHHNGREQVVPAFQVSAVNNEYVYTLTAEPPAAGQP